MMTIPILRILAGILLLFLGRRLFWLFVGVIGFVAGMTFGTQFFAGQPEWVVFVVAIISGLIGIFLAFFLQRIAVAVAGFLAGALLATNFLSAISLSVPPLFPMIIGGIIGAILLSLVFDWALIFLSSATGAALIVQSVHLEPLFGLLAFVVLVIIGISFQARILRPTHVPRSQQL
jgi:Domain of unknown function (DUF4203)